MILSSTSEEIKLVTSSTADIEVAASWADQTVSTFVPGSTDTIITSATTTTVVASPASSTYRQVKTLVIANRHASTSNTVTVQHYDGTNTINVIKKTLAAGESLEYTGTQWVAYDSSGVPILSFVTNMTVGSSAISGGTSGRILYDNAGVLGEKTTTGSGSVVLDTSPTLTTAVLGSSTATTQSANDSSTKVATTAYADTSSANAKNMVEMIGMNDINSSIGNNTYTLVFYAEYGFTINELKIISGSGTCTAAVKINGTDVTGISAVSVSTSVATGTATAANTVVVGDKVTLVLSSTSSLNNLQATLKITRT